MSKEAYSQDNDLQNYIQGKKDLYQILLKFINSIDDNIEEKYEKLKQVIYDQNIIKEKYELFLFLNMIVKISNNMYRDPHFFDKIKKIIINLKETIIQTYSNYEIFDIFKSSKILLLFLFEEKIISIDESIIEVLEANKYNDKLYDEYFSPEINEFNDEKTTNPEFFEENRQNGENQSEISKLIRNDLIDKFISYVNQNDISLNSKIELSQFETNSLLLKKKTNTYRICIVFWINSNI